jgi:hypothetical protein
MILLLNVVTDEATRPAVLPIIAWQPPSASSLAGFSYFFVFSRFELAT